MKSGRSAEFIRAFQKRILFYPLGIDGYFKMGDMSGGNFPMNNNTLSQQDCDPNIGDVTSRYGFINSHTISQCKDLSIFRDMKRGV